MLINMKIIFQIILENLKDIIKIMQFFIYMFLRFLKIVFQNISKNSEKSRIMKLNNLNHALYAL